MARQNVQKMANEAWALARSQHYVVTRKQLHAIGYTLEAIDCRIEDGRLHRIYRGVDAVGRRDLTRDGVFIAAVLACGPTAALSHQSAGQLWGILPRQRGLLHVSVPASCSPERNGIRVHRRASLEGITYRGIRVTNPVDTLVDLATCLPPEQLERAVNEAVNRDLTEPERLRRALTRMTGRRGVPALVRLLDRDTFVVTDSRLEQRFVPIALAAGLPKPLTQRHLEGARVDFYWPELRLIVEADSLRFHRTPSQQAADALRNQRHAAAGLTPLRFTHWQIFHNAEHVRNTLAAVAARLAAAAAVA